MRTGTPASRMARDQIKEGAHILDVCVDYTGADGVADMDALMARLATQSSAPLMVDTTEAPVARAGAHAGSAGGRCSTASTSKRATDEGTRLDCVPLARARVRGRRRRDLHRRGGPGADRRLEGARRDAAIVATRRRPLRALPRGRLHRPARAAALDRPRGVAARRHRDDRGDPADQDRAARRAHRSSGSRTSRSASAPAARQALNSVFLHECAEAGLDAAIVHASKILPLAKIDERARAACLDLIYDRRHDDYDPLTVLLELFEGVEVVRHEPSTTSRSCRSTERLSRRIIDGDRDGLDDDLDEALGRRPERRSTIVNDHLLEGMRVVGDLFATGEMQLPFVLQSAETMKQAVAHLEPHMERTDSRGKGTIVLATVKGDVHDIGKNLVDIILTNNGYDVVNLGIKVGINEMLAAVEEHKADALGMSGLLVKSTLIMRENLEVMRDLGYSPRAGAARRRGADAHLRRARAARVPRRARLLRQGRLRGAARA